MAIRLACVYLMISVIERCHCTLSEADKNTRFSNDFAENNVTWHVL